MKMAAAAIANAVTGNIAMVSLAEILESGIPGPAALGAFDRARRAATGTPLGPLFDRAMAALAREEPGSRLTGSVGWHGAPGGWRLEWT